MRAPGAPVPWSSGPHHRSCPHCSAGRAGIRHGRRLAQRAIVQPGHDRRGVAYPAADQAGHAVPRALGKAGMEMLAELTEFERPYRLGSRTTSSMMETSGRLTFTAEGDGTVMSWDWQVRPKGWLRMLGPLSGILGGRMERRIWTGLKDLLEDNGSALRLTGGHRPHALHDPHPRRPRTASESRNRPHAAPMRADERRLAAAQTTIPRRGCWTGRPSPARGQAARRASRNRASGSHHPP